MVLTTDQITEIVNHWATDFSSAGMSALRQLDAYAQHALAGKEIRIPHDRIVLSNIYDFLTWKNSQQGLSDIPVLGERSMVATAELVNELLSDTRIDALILQKGAKRLIFQGSGIKFTIDTCEILRGDILPDNAYNLKFAKVEFVTYHEYKFSADIEDAKVSKLHFHCRRLAIK